MDSKAVYFVLILLLKVVFSEILSQPFTGPRGEGVSILAVDIQSPGDGRRVVIVSFTATHPPQFLWEVGGRPVMYYDTNYVTLENGTSATLYLNAEDADKTVRFNIILRLFQESVLIQMSNAIPGWYPLPNHALPVTPSEGFIYNATTDLDNVLVDAALAVENDNNQQHQYNNLRLSIMIVIPDYCSRPVKPIFGFTSSNPEMLQISRPNEHEKFVGMTNWRANYPDSNIEAWRINITSVSHPSWRQGMLVVGSMFDSASSSNPIMNVHTIRRVFFKPSPLFQDYIMQNTVTFIGWHHDLVVDEHEDADFHIYAIGNPVPRITVAKNGFDISTMVERRDIEEAYFKHAIFRFKDITVENSGRYICTAVSGSGRIKETFTVYVRTACSPGQ